MQMDVNGYEALPAGDVCTDTLKNRRRHLAEKSYNIQKSLSLRTLTPGTLL